VKFAEPRPYADPDKAARKLVEIANTIEAVQDGRLHIEKINAPFPSDWRQPRGIRRRIKSGHRIGLALET
jgi:hypothetical protein